MLFSKVLMDWWTCDRINLSKTTALKKKMVIDKHIIPFFGDMDIKDIDELKIIEFIQSEKTTGNKSTGQPLCQNSVIKEVNIIKNVMKYAIAKGYIEITPFDFIKPLKYEPIREFEIFTSDEVERIIELAKPKWLGDMIGLAYHTGMRKCECFGLQWIDIDFKNGILNVKRSVTEFLLKQIEINDVKTKNSYRSILLDDYSVSILTERYKNRKSEIWVFADENGELLSPWESKRQFRKICNKAGIYGKRFHDLRHTHITELVKMGIPLPVIQMRVGHADISMTMHYTHVKNDAQNEIIEKMNLRGKKDGKEE